MVPARDNDRPVPKVATRAAFHQDAPILVCDLSGLDVYNRPALEVHALINGKVRLKAYVLPADRPLLVQVYEENVRIAADLQALLRGNHPKTWAGFAAILSTKVSRGKFRL